MNSDSNLKQATDLELIVAGFRSREDTIYSPTFCELSVVVWHGISSRLKMIKVATIHGKKSSVSIEE